MSRFHFELVSPEKLSFSGEVDSVVLPASEGEITVLAGHAPLMTVLKSGIVTIHEGRETRRLFLRGGFADINPSRLTLLAEHALPMEEFDAARLEREIKDAEEDLADALGDSAKQSAQRKLTQLQDMRGSIAAAH